MLEKFQEIKFRPASLYDDDTRADDDDEEA